MAWREELCQSSILGEKCITIDVGDEKPEPFCLFGARAASCAQIR